MAIIRDRHSGRESAQAMSRMASIIMAAPLLAPVIGALILKISDWRSIFMFLFGYGLILSVALFMRLPETLATPRRPIVKPVAQLSECAAKPNCTGLPVFGCGQLRWHVCLYHGPHPGCISATTAYHPSVYPILFGANIVTLLLCNRINIRLLHRFSPQQLLQGAQKVQLLAATALLLGYLLTPAPVWMVLVLVMLFIGMQGFVMSNAMAGTSEFFPPHGCNRYGSDRGLRFRDRRGWRDSDRVAGGRHSPAHGVHHVCRRRQRLCARPLAAAAAVSLRQHKRLNQPRTKRLL